MDFKPARLDLTAAIISSGVTLFITGLSLFFIIKLPYGWAFAVFMELIVIGSFALSPKKYSLRNGSLVIEKYIGTKIIIPVTDIDGYVTIPKFCSLTISRTFGNGGLFGYYGVFSTAEYGELHCQLTSMHNVIIVRTKNRSYAISPLAYAIFEEQLKAHVNHEPVTTLQPNSKPIDKASALILIVPVMLFIVFVVITLIQYAQLPDRIAVHFNMHGTPDRWGPKSSYLFSSLVPASILFACCIAVFFAVRKTTRNKAIPQFLVIILSFIELFIIYTSMNTYWITKHNSFLVQPAIGYSLFGLLLVVLLFVYYRRIVKK
jgi:hypothetical protein